MEQTIPRHSVKEVKRAMAKAKAKKEEEVAQIRAEMKAEMMDTMKALGINNWNGDDFDADDEKVSAIAKEKAVAAAIIVNAADLKQQTKMKVAWSKRRFKEDFLTTTLKVGTTKCCVNELMTELCKTSKWDSVEELVAHLEQQYFARYKAEHQ